MKMRMGGHMIFPLIFMFFSCSENQQTKDSHSTEFELVEEESYSFRRAYHGQDTLEGKEWDVFMNRNPEPCEDFEQSKNHHFYSLLKEAKIFQEGNLNLVEIDTLPDQFDYQFSSNRKFTVDVSLIEDPKVVEAPSYELVFKEKGELLLVDTLAFGWPPDITLFTRDVNHDGKEELFSLFRWYIVNGDNYDLRMYQLKEKPHQSED